MGGSDVCMLIRTKSGVLSLVLTTKYVNELVERGTAGAAEAKDDRPWVMLMESR